MAKSKQVLTAKDPAVTARAKEEAAYINREIGGFLAAANRSEGQANETQRTLSGQLLLVSGAILTFSATAIIGDGATSDLSAIWKWTIILAWVSLGTSAALGIAQIYQDSNFFILWHKYNVGIAKELKTGKYISTNIENVFKLFKKPRESSDTHYLKAQTVLLATGTALFLVVVSHLLFVKSATTTPADYNNTPHRLHHERRQNLLIQSS